MDDRFPRLSVLWTFIRPHRGALAVGLLLGLLGTATSLATPMVVKWVLDTLGAGGSLTAPVVWLLVLLVFGTTVFLVQWVLLGTVAERVVLHARTSIVRRLLGARIGDVTSRPNGEMVTRVTSDTVLLREAASSAAVGIINAVVGLVGTIVLMAVLDLVLVAATLACVAVVFVLFARLMPAIATAQKEAQEAVGHVGSELDGTLRAIRTVKASRAELRQGDRIIEQARTSMGHSIRAVRTSAIAWSVSWSGVQLSIIVVLGIGAWRVESGLLGVSSLIAFLLYAFQLVGPITDLSQNITALQSGLAAAERIQEIDTMAAEADLTPEPTSHPAHELALGPYEAPVLELRGVSAGYVEDRAVVHDVDLVVPRHGHVAIVGPSGAGKTTLFSLLLRFLEPTAGEIRLDGRPYTSLSVDEVRARLAYVEQETPVVPGTIGDNARFTHPDASGDEVAAALRAVQLDGVVAELPDGLDTSLTTSALSGGQRQRLALARAIVRLPDVLLLDEATAQVDGITEAAIQECIAVASRQGAVVTIAHRLSTVLDADMIVVLEHGRVRARGRHDELMASDELYRDLVHALRIEVAAAAV